VLKFGILDVCIKLKPCGFLLMHYGMTELLMPRAKLIHKGRGKKTRFELSLINPNRRPETRKTWYRNSVEVWNFGYIKLKLFGFLLVHLGTTG
jgi:hypothetical protein